TSAIVEPMSFSYYDTTQRAHRTVSISAQRVAYSERTKDLELVPDRPVKPSRLPAWPEALAAMVVLLGTICSALWGRGLTLRPAMPAVSWLDPVAICLRVAAWRADVKGVRRAATAMMARDGALHRAHRESALALLDERIFGASRDKLDLTGFARNFLRNATKNHSVS
ncbi:MAG: hypothetical protein AAGA73_09995, partial [Pseudomonadota bacterium]